MDNKNKKLKTNNNDFLDKTILLVNTGWIRKRFIIQKLKKMGLKIVVLNKEKNWAQPYVDHWILADSTNHTESIQAIKDFMANNPTIKINGVITFWEDDVLLTSKIIDKFNFLGIPLNISKKVRNKYLFRAFCQENNLPSPKYSIVKSLEDVKNISQKLNFPMVIKPIFGACSSFVVKVNDEEELISTYQYIKKSLSLEIESALSDGNDIMIEEYIDGDEVDVDILIQNGRIKFYSISDNTKTNEPFFIETGRFTPSSLPEKDKEALKVMTDEVLERLGVQNGCIHFEAKSTRKGPVPIEVNLRMGGDEIYESVKKAWKVDLIEEATKIALGIYFPKINKPANPYIYLVSHDFLSNYSGIIVQVDIDDQLEKMPFVEEVEFLKKIGDSVLVPPEGYEYLGWIMVSGDSLLDAQTNLEEALEHIKYEIARFQPASSIGKTLRKNYFSSSVINKDILVRRGKIEKIRRMSIQNQRNLHIGIAYNFYESDVGEVEKDLMSIGQNLGRILAERGYRITLFDFNNLSRVFEELKKSDVDLIFNVCERINESSLLEPHAAAILDALQIPYTGSSAFTLALCIDKIRVKKLLAFHNIPTPKWDYAYTMDDEIDKSLEYPLIVKPANTDNSIGITNESVVVNQKELKRQLKKVIIDIGRPALVEEYIEGDEYDVSILGSEEDDLRVLPLSRDIFDKMPPGYWHIYPFEAKWKEGNIYKKNIIVQRPPKNISKKLSKLITEIALDTYNILDCHDYGRVEVRVDKNNNPYVLELNPNPSIALGDCVPEVAKLVGMDYGDFLEEIIQMAIKRYKNHPPYFHLQPSII
ncbi:ATP-grasp domain-containing protein [bacterium]|nr:MAG: ATP-grasp domain-containing protein [bacterium]